MVLTALLALSLPNHLFAQTSEQHGVDSNAHFVNFLNGIWPQARRQAISQKTFVKALQGVRPDEEILDAQQNQPEFVRPVWS